VNGGRAEVEFESEDDRSELRVVCGPSGPVLEADDD